MDANNYKNEVPSSAPGAAEGMQQAHSENHVVPPQEAINTKKEADKAETSSASGAVQENVPATQQTYIETPAPQPAQENVPAAQEIQADIPATGYAQNETMAQGETQGFTPPQNAPVQQAPYQPAAAAVPQNAAYGTPSPYYQTPYTYPAPARNKKEPQPFAVSSADSWFLLTCFALGFLFVRCVLYYAWSGWGVTLFSLLFAGTVLVFTRAKRIKPKAESWFWLAILLLTSATFLWYSNSHIGLWLNLWRTFLHCASAVYWCVTLYGGQLAQKTSNYALLDMFNAIFIVPFKNWDVLFPTFKNLSSKEGKNKKGILRVLPVLLGVLLCIPLFGYIIPKLLSADSGNFFQAIQFLFENLSLLFVDRSFVYVMQIAFSIPFSLYIFGLVAGYAHKRCTTNFDLKKMNRRAQSVRFVPEATSVTVLTLVAVLYIVFIACQGAYFFSAFTGARPEGMMVYSTYAREGFFELCRISIFNIVLLFIANIFNKRERKNSLPLRVVNIVFSVLTILIIATAFSKMALYIDAYGLTVKRILTCVFMVFLAGVYAGIIAMQFKTFSIVRYGVVLGAVCMCAVCMVNLEARIIHYNANRFLNGTLNDFDICMVRSYNLNGYEDSLRVLKSEKLTEDEQEVLEEALSQVIKRNARTEGRSADCFANATARRLNAEYEAEQEKEES